MSAAFHFKCIFSLNFQKLTDSYYLPSLFLPLNPSFGFSTLLTLSPHFNHLYCRFHRSIGFSNPCCSVYLFSSCFTVSLLLHPSLQLSVTESLIFLNPADNLFYCVWLNRFASPLVWFFISHTDWNIFHFYIFIAGWTCTHKLTRG